MDHRQLLSELYQILGALDAPETVLDQVAAAAAGQPLPHETLLPFAPDSQQQAQPVAELRIMDGVFSGYTYANASKFPEGTKLYPEQPRPRAQLMRVAEAVRDATKASLKEQGSAFKYHVWGDIDLAAIVDAIQPQAAPKCATCQDSGIVGHSDICPDCTETWAPKQQHPAPVNQQMLAVPDAIHAAVIGLGSIRSAVGLGKVDVALVRVDEIRTMLAEAIPAAESAQAQQPADEVLTFEHQEVVRMLLWLTHTVVTALDDSEECEASDGRVHIIGADNFDAISDALDDLEKLPDDKPGYTLSASGKAEWALRTMLTALAAHKAQKGQS